MEINPDVDTPLISSINVKLLKTNIHRFNEKDLKNLFNEAEKENFLGRREQALAKYMIVIEKCNLFMSEHEFEDSESCVSKMVALAYNNVGHLQYLSVDFDEAIKNYSKAIVCNPSLDVAFYNRGLIHYRTGRYEEALTDQRKCLVINPQFLSAKQCIEQIRLEQENLGDNDRDSNIDFLDCVNYPANTEAVLTAQDLYNRFVASIEQNNSDSSDNDTNDDIDIDVDNVYRYNDDEVFDDSINQEFREEESANEYIYLHPDHWTSDDNDSLSLHSLSTNGS